VVIWLNGTVGAGKSAVGKAVAAILPGAVFVDGDDHAGPPHLPQAVRWHMALEFFLRRARCRGRSRILVVAYPLGRSGHARLRATCGRAHRRLVVVTLAPPLGVTLRGRGDRELDPWERKRIRQMRSEGFHRRRFATFTIPNAQPPVRSTASRIVALIRR
jgi:hypothetical protein